MAYGMGCQEAFRKSYIPHCWDRQLWVRHGGVWKISVHDMAMLGMMGPKQDTICGIKILGLFSFVQFNVFFLKIQMKNVLYCLCSCLVRGEMYTHGKYRWGPPGQCNTILLSSDLAFPEILVLPWKGSGVGEKRTDKQIISSKSWEKVNFIYFEVVLVPNIKYGEETLCLVSP